MDEQPISRPKITPVPLRPTTLLRERLIDRLCEGARGRLTLVVAEAGFGKTTLLADFSHRNLVRCLWYKLDSSDRDWVSFLTYLVAAGREAQPEFAPRTHELLSSSNPEREATITSFLSELPELADGRTVLILDDFNVVDDSGDVQDVLGRVLENGPDGFGLVVVSRRQPPLALGRLAAQGALVELSTDDLRFSRAETDDLFRAVYGQPLEQDVIDEIDSRTEGWAASLQLLHSSIRERSASEIRTFVRRMSGAEGRIYDFLAEEVLRELPSELARFMVLASLLERIVPEHVVPLFPPGEPAPSLDQASSWIVAVADLGLAGKRSESSRSYRFHPLLREFLQRRLRETHSKDQIREMHLRVARAAEADDWLTACRHYLDGGAAAEAMRVLDASALEAIGGGLWEPVAALVERQPNQQSDAVWIVILARKDLALGQPQRCLARLRNVDLSQASPLVNGLGLLARAAASWYIGDDEDVVAAVSALLADHRIPAVLRGIGEAIGVLRETSAGGSVRNYVAYLEGILPRQRAERLHHFTATTLHNLCWGELHLGNYRKSIEYGEASLEERRLVPVSTEETGATLAVLAESSFELGLWNQGDDFLARARARSTGQVDALGHTATLLAALGRNELAREVLDEWKDGIDEEQSHPAGLLEYWRAAVTLGEPMPEPESRDRRYLQDVAARSSVAYLRTASYLIADSLREAAASARDGELIVGRQGTRHWARRLRVVGAIARGDGNELHRLLSGAGTSQFMLLELSPAICNNLHVLPDIPDALRSSVDRWPSRWLPQLRRQLARGSGVTSLRAAELLDAFGTKEDVVLLRAYERTYLRGSKARGLGRALRRRTASPLQIHDLGRTQLVVGDRTVPGTRMRRRALALLLFLTTRPNMTATREQVLEALWPRADPESANNSLHQTLFFLRRDIDPWFDEDTSFSYVRNEGDLVWLDSGMVFARSVTFAMQAAGLNPVVATPAHEEVLELYEGQFAPEFEYEDWAMARRERLHAQFLALAESQVRVLWEASQLEAAIATAQRTLVLDSDALHLEGALVALYAKVGAATASQRQYEHYARRIRESFGVEPQSRAALLALQPRDVRTLH